MLDTGETVTPYVSIPAVVVWAITALAIFGIVNLVKAIGGGISNALGSIDFWRILGTILLIAVVGLLVVSFFRKRRGAIIGTLLLGALAIAGIVLLITHPQLVAPLLVVGLMVYLLYRMIKL